MPRNAGKSELGLFFRVPLAKGELDRGGGLIQISGMIQTIDALAQGAIELPPDQRFALAQRILASMEPEEAAGIDDAWTVEIQERIRKFDAGETKGIPGAEVFAEIDRRLPYTCLHGWTVSPEF